MDNKLQELMTLLSMLGAFVYLHFYDATTAFICNISNDLFSAIHWAFGFRWGHEELVPIGWLYQ